jgi:hypothetical protein
MYWWFSPFRQISLGSGGIIESVEMSGLVLYLCSHTSQWRTVLLSVAGGLGLVCFSGLFDAVHTIAGIWLSTVCGFGVLLSPGISARA